MKFLIFSSSLSRRYSIIFRIFLSAVGLFVLFPTSAEVIHINNTRLVRLMNEGVPLIDIRTPGEWENTGVISGSRLITFFNEQGQVNVPQWQESVKTFAKPDRPIILICHSGTRSLEAARFLSETVAYRTVYNVSNGMMGWLADRQPVVPASP
jgi:Rhodanese-related sulfurtransferase